LKNKNATIRAELIGALFASVGLSVLCMLVICFAMIVASASMAFAIFFNENVFAFIILFLIIFATLTIVFFLILIKKRIQYLEEIISALGNISEGNLNISIPVKTKDELGRMADTVNVMAYQLKTTMEEERRLEKSKTDFKDEEKLRRYISIAYEQCKELNMLIGELFEFSKLSNPGMVISKAPISMREILEQVILGFIPTIEEAGMEYRLFFPDDKLIVNVDPLLLTRVFDNLVNNAIKYGREGKYLDVELNKENDEAIVKIINYGEAISDVDLPYVFERFYRADKSRSGKKKGSGLGLAIVKSIVELHNGTIAVISTDKRTVFEVRLKIDQ